MPDLTQISKHIFLETLQAIEPGSVIKRELQLENDRLSLGGSEQLSLDSCDEVVLIGMGKASITMGAAVESILGDRIKRGILVTDRRARLAVRSEVIVAGHPLPDSRSLLAASKIIDIIQSSGGGSLIIFLISGGGSALVEMPFLRQTSLEDLRVTNQILIGCGASIHEINVVRKHLSRIKGGRLGYLARNLQCAGLYFSDVNPGDIRAIASNPLLPEELNAEEFIDVVNKFSLMEKLPPSIAEAIERGDFFDSVPDWSREAKQPVTALLLDNSKAVQAAAELAKRRGFRVEVNADLIEGDYREVADRSVEHLLKLKASFPGERVCVISGGEASCSVRGEGVGGRNQEFVLYSAALLAGSGIREGAAVLSCGTDGIDGNSNAAGAVASPESVINAARDGEDALSFISNSDTHSFFKKVGGLVVTGPTGNNVRDLRILMAQ